MTLEELEESVIQTVIAAVCHVCSSDYCYKCCAYQGYELDIKQLFEKYKLEHSNNEEV